jgi:hypothetical protein
MRRRWVARLARMDRLERLMLMEALSSSNPATNGGGAGAP